MLQTFKNGQGSIVLRVKILDSTATTGAGLAGLTSASSGLIISTIADNEATATAYTVAGSTIETITTLGTYAAPTATKVRFKEVDATNHKGVYELQIADARFAVASSKSLLVSLLGATSMAQADFVVQLQSDDPYVAKPANSNLTSIDSNGRLDMIKLAGTTQTARDLGTSVLLSNGTGTGQLKLASGYVAMTLADVDAPTTTLALTGTTIGTVTNLTNAATNGDLTATMKASVNTEVDTAISDAALATAVNLAAVKAVTDKLDTMVEVTSGSPGDYEFTQDALRNAPTGTGGSGSGPSVEDIVAGVWGEALPGAFTSGQAGKTVGDNLNATITSRMATYVQPTGFLAATFPGGTVANTTNITAGVLTTVTNLTNAATAGDLTATMKASVNAETDTALLDVGLTTTITSRIDVATGTRASQTSVNAIGVVTDELATMIELTSGSPGDYEFTQDALRNAPTGTGGGGSGPTAAEVADAVWDEILAGHAGAGSTGAALSAAGSAGDPWITPLPGAYGAGTAGKIVGDNINATISSRASQSSVDIVDGIVDSILLDSAAIKVKTDFLPSATAGAAGGVFIAGTNAATAITTALTANIIGNLTGNLSGSAGSVVGAVGSVTGFTASDVAAIKAKTDNLPAAPAAVGNIPTAVENADALLNRDMATGTDSGSPTVRTPRQAFRFLRNKWTIIGTTLSVKKEDDSTESWSGVVTATPGADPITGSDPAS